MKEGIKKCMECIFVLRLSKIEVVMMILLQQFSMNQQDQRVSQALEKALAKQEGVKGNSFSNCIINTHSSFVIYSYFNAFANKDNIEFQLVSIFADTKGEGVRVVVQKVEFDSYFKVKTKEAEELQFNVKTNPKDQVFHIVEMRMHSKNDEVKSKFFTFGLEAEMITQGESIIFSSISARKPIKQVHWHPDNKATFIALTTDDFSTYSLENRGDQVTTLKQLEIHQPIVDFHFWKDAGKQEYSYISALSGSGKTYIIAEEDQSLQVKRIVDCQSLTQFNWTTIKVFKAEYNKQNVLLSIKAGNVYKKNVKEPMFQVYQLSYDEKKGQFSEKLIVRVNGIAGSKAQHDFLFPFQELFNSSLLYCHDNKIMRLNLSKWLDFLTSKQTTKTYRFHSKQAQAQIFIELDKVEVKFVLFKKGEAVIVRSHGSTAFNFSRTSTDINEFESQGLSITNKINKALKEIQEELNKKIEVSKEPELQDKIDLLPEEASDADVDKFLGQTNRFIDSSQKIINNEQDEIKRLINEIKTKSDRLEKLKYQKVELQKWEERIKDNAERIEKLQEEQSEYKTEEDEKIEELGNMIDFVKNKPIDLSEEVKKECSAIIQSQISLIQDIERKYKLAEEEFNKLNK